MQEQIITLLKKYEDGVPLKIERTTIFLLAAATILVVFISALIVKYVKKI